MVSNNQIATEPALTSEAKKGELPAAALATPETCPNNYGVIIALAIVMVSLMVPIGILAQKIKNLKNAAPTSEMANFDST